MLAGRGAGAHDFDGQKRVGGPGRIRRPFYACPVPVSRKRKKSRKSKTSRPAAGRQSRFDVAGQTRHEWASALENLAAHRRHDARRASLANAAAEALVAELVDLAPQRSDSALEDELCARVGPRLYEMESGPIDDHVGPDLFADALVTAAAGAVRVAWTVDSTDPAGWQGPWRTLSAVARIVPFPLSATSVEAIANLRDLPGGAVLADPPASPAVTGQVLWTRDRYGSRFGVTASFSTPDGSDRWYLWDIDACGHQAFTVHSGYYATIEQALEAWQAGVGPLAADGTAWAPVGDPSLLAELMPGPEGFLRTGGESAAQFAEYHRSRRLAASVVETLGSRRGEPRTTLDAPTAADQFVDWLREHRVDLPPSADLDELATELADSWSLDAPAALYGTCSPHRVALTVLHLRNYYQDDFAAELIALLPDWISWLAERNGIAPALAERCRPYALGEPHADVGSDDSHPNYLARLAE